MKEIHWQLMSFISPVSFPLTVCGLALPPLACSKYFHLSLWCWHYEGQIQRVLVSSCQYYWSLLLTSSFLKYCSLAHRDPHSFLLSIYSTLTSPQLSPSFFPEFSACSISHARVLHRLSFPLLVFSTHPMWWWLPFPSFPTSYRFFLSSFCPSFVLSMYLPIKVLVHGL